ncbi:MAG: 50S ribosomal protein L22 [Chthonomonadales bacterium]|nr:50S ribosomal protein L22 [Chthonomonadales bacterium]
MGKPKTESSLKPSQASATAKYLRVPPRKARLVMDAVRGKYVSDALAALQFVPNFAARAIEKVIKSAVSNAENGRPNGENGRPLQPLITENLRLVRGTIDEGPRIKRVQPRAQGRAYRIIKRMCHISVIVEEVEPKPRKPRATAAGRRARAAGRTTPSSGTAAPSRGGRRGHAAPASQAGNEPVPSTTTSPEGAAAETATAE